MSLTKTAALELAKTHHWKHSFELAPGIISKGDWGLIDSKKILSETYGLPDDLSGKTVLDIGALDGVHSFEAERRGAKVTALDIQSPDVTGFNIAKTIKRSKVEYVQGNVYDLVEMFGNESFDIVLYFGVWYHLKNPVRAMEEVAAVLKSGGTLCGEGAVLKEYVELDGRAPTEEEKALVRAISDSNLGLSLYYSGVMNGDLWNWYVPNRACVLEWLKTAGLSSTSHAWWNEGQHQRLHVTAVKDGKILTTVDNPVW
jgi:tRNA (mo5U34)-methyltransferase